MGNAQPLLEVSTHSRPKAAGVPVQQFSALGRVSTHSRPKAAGRTGYLLVY